MVMTVTEAVALKPDVDAAIEAMRTRTTDDGHIATVAELQRAYAGARLTSLDGALQKADPTLRLVQVVRAVAGENENE